MLCLKSLVNRASIPHFRDGFEVREQTSNFKIVLKNRTVRINRAYIIVILY